MRLKQIKLAGFKSFVDPTTVPFPAQMTAIVGPNGCGKSNIIDAVRWVLGEGSAKNLRGESMTDVIFNGSSARKPVSQCSIELVFDNSEQRLQGEFAKYAEIAVKRMVNRDAVSSYFLNGTKCRKKDITELFLGTGLGPRSYAIIEQGMISRLIESKPQDLRLFIEEAAGISKYKERRRETENRIKHTRDNLERLEDVRGELAQQLEKLQRQAAAARRFKELKAKERLLKAEYNLLRWMRMNDKREGLELEIREQQNNLEALLTEQSSSDASLVERKEQAQQVKEKIETLGQQLFLLAQQIAKTEQNQIHLKEKQYKLTQDVQHLQSEQAQLQGRLLQQNEQQQLLAEDLEILEPEREELELRLEEWQIKLAETEQTQQQALSDWQQGSQQYYQAENRLKTAQAKVQSLEQVMIKTKQRIHSIETELGKLNQTQTDISIEEIEQELALLNEQKAEQQIELETLNEAQTDNKNKQSEWYVQLNQLNQQHQKITGRISSISTLVEKLSQSGNQALQNWLAHSNLAIKGKLLDYIDVEAGWESAVERQLADWKSAILVDQLPEIDADLQPPADLVLIKASYQLQAQTNTLAAKVTAPDAVIHRLNAIRLQPNSSENSATFLRQDTLYNGSWQQYFAGETDSVLELKNELVQLEQERNQLTQQIEQVEQQLSQIKGQIGQISEQLKHQESASRATESELVKLATQLQLKQSEIDNRLARQQQLQGELTEQQDSLEQELYQQETLEMDIESASEALMTLESQQQDASQRKLEIEQLLQNQRQQTEQAKSQLHQLLMKLQQVSNELNNCKQDQARFEEQQRRIGEKLEMDKVELEEIVEPMEVGNIELQEALESKVELEQRKAEQADQLSEIETGISDIEKGQHGVFSQAEKIREQISSLKVDVEGVRVSANNVLEAFNETGLVMKDVIEHLSADAEEAQWQTELTKTSAAINRLGAINLAAIDEYDHQAERKTYLDAQHEDLVSALDTLEDAIRRIDRETKNRFKITFDSVNADLKQLFPKVFGGGAAWLELTDDDLLETGVTIMARPPGKRNSTIHLLSGGEKALTALSLVFAIFRLNPAPFCMLDEVDAPLDDANVGRFCRLVEEMSSTVQFIFISHNKIAMEMAMNLVGVTMQEPGVSRMVAVDIEKAVKLAEA